ncbi:MAG: ABC transporter ATP-binding protein [Bacteroidetes bacterium]|nr:MAG: ABC transporter ATP-binding protein [Bacteroidota bacterium]
MSAVELEHIVKTYQDGGVTAVKDFSLKVNEGELFGLIGPDGAGKTTIFRILTTLILADSGRASVNGYDVVEDYNEIRKRVGYMPGRFSLYQDLTVAENLHFFATVFKTTIEENYDMIRDIYEQIEPFKDRRAGKLSGGMKQKLALCCALIHKPEVLFLDEPTTGVDAVSRKEFWQMLDQLKKHGITMLVSTPYMDEAVRCDRIALMQQGSILAMDSPEQLVRSFSGKLYQAKSEQKHRLLKDLRKHPQVVDTYSFGEYLHLRTSNDSKEVLEALKQELLVQGHEQLVMEECAPTIEDCFIRLLNQE